ncbi:MAG: patatin-like phospholipase family protein [Pygmaiobacter sp.]
MTKGLVLAGGGARGAYQVGVKRALDELCFVPEVFTGTSVGCLNAGLFALGLDSVAESMWLQLSDKDIMVLPEKFWGGELIDFLHNLQVGGGLDVSPLEQTVRMLLDEDALRRSGKKFGLITVNKRTLKPLEVGLDEIPTGKLADYMMASAACFPAIRPHTLEGEDYIDGGYYENMPIDLAARLGANEIVAVNLDGIGFSRRPKAKGLKLRYVGSYWPLGTILKFDPEVSRRNIALGYLDTYRAFGKLKGLAYSFRPAEYTALLQTCGVRYQALVDSLAERHFAFDTVLALPTAKGHGRPKNPQQALLYALETAAERLELDPTVVYTASEFCTALVDAFYIKNKNGFQFSALICDEDEPSVLTLARALASTDQLQCELAVLAAAAQAPAIP